MTPKELAMVLKVSIDAVRKALSKLYRSGEVERINLEKDLIEEKGKKYSGRHYVYRILD